MRKELEYLLTLTDEELACIKEGIEGIDFNRLVRYTSNNPYQAPEERYKTDYYDFDGFVECIKHLEKNSLLR